MANIWIADCFSRYTIANGKRLRTNFRVSCSPAGHRAGDAITQAHSSIYLGDKLGSCSLAPIQIPRESGLQVGERGWVDLQRISAH